MSKEHLNRVTKTAFQTETGLPNLSLDNACVSRTSTEDPIRGNVTNTVKAFNLEYHALVTVMGFPFTFRIDDLIDGGCNCLL